MQRRVQRTPLSSQHFQLPNHPEGRWTFLKVRSLSMKVRGKKTKGSPPHRRSEEAEQEYGDEDEERELIEEEETYKESEEEAGARDSVSKLIFELTSVSGGNWIKKNTCSN